MANKGCRFRERNGLTFGEPSQQSLRSCGFARDYFADPIDRAAVEIMVAKHEVDGNTESMPHLGEELRRRIRFADISAQQERIELLIEDV